MTEQLKLTGELTIFKAEELVATLREALQANQHLHIDLTAVEQLDTASAQILVAAKHQAVQSAIPITFSCSAMVNKRLGTLGIHL